MTDREIDIMERLPMGEAPEELREWALKWHTDSDLGGSKILFHQESVETVETVPQLERIMGPEDWDRYECGIKRHWGAVCDCSFCGDSFTAGYTSDSKLGIKGIALFIGEEGLPYDGWIDPGDPGAAIYSAGELMNCPLCGQEGELLPQTSIRGGRTYRVLVLEVRELAGLTALIYWEISRTCNRDGYFWTHTAPFSAVVLDGKKLIQFDHVHNGMSGTFVQNESWRLRKTVCDPEQMRYCDCGSTIGIKIGAYLWPRVPALTGSSGEKTGLEAYLKAEGGSPVLYLKLWQKHPCIENIVKSGWGAALVKSINKQLDDEHNCGRMLEKIELAGINWRESRPNRMLGMSKSEFQAAAQAKWSFNTLGLWRKYTVAVEYCGVEDFIAWQREIGRTIFTKLAEAAVSGDIEGFEFSTVIMYLRKQKDCTLSEGAELLMDYRRMLDVPMENATHELLWPPRLRAAHDNRAKFFKSDGEHYRQKAFDDIVSKYGALEWNDGKYCVLLPRCNGELIREGDTLRHCVGGYGDTHLAGSLIFFVRHYRRPERSWHTLNIDMTGKDPRRIQLHGYGNERHGKNKERRHKLPQEVIDFCDRWEKEVLRPWFYAQRRAEAEEQKRTKKKGSDAA